MDRRGRLPIRWTYQAPSAINTNPAAATEEYGMMILRWRRIYNLVFENNVVKSFLRAIPGFEDYTLIGKAWYHTTEEKRRVPVWDTLVFDMPASGHSLSMLRIPKVIVETVPDGPLTRDAGLLLSLLRDRERTGIALVTLAEEMPANEARELASKLEAELEIRPDALIVNQVYPDHFAPGSPSRVVLDALRAASAPLPMPLPPLLAQADVATARRDVQRQHLAELEKMVMPLIELPILFEEIRRPQIAALAETLAASLGTTPS